MRLIVALAFLFAYLNGFSPIVYKHYTLGHASAIKLQVFGMTLLHGVYSSGTDIVIFVTIGAFVLLAASDLLDTLKWILSPLERFFK